MPAKLSQPPSPPAKKAEAAPRPAAPPAQREYAALRLFLSQDAGFRLALATFDRPATRDGLTARLVDDLAKSQVLLSVLDLVAGEGSLLQRVKEHLATQPTPPGWRRALAITNLEARLDPNKLPIRNRADADRDLTFLEEANLHRDAFPTAAPCPVLLWLTQLAETDFAKSAPDLWHWRNARFDFEREGSFLADFRAHPAERIAWFEKITAAARRLGDKRGELSDLIELGNAKLDTGDARGAIPHYDAALARARELDDRRGEGAALGNLGNAYADLGDARKAIEFHEQALVIDREIGDRRGEGAALGNLGLAYADLGDARKAIEFYEQCLKLLREIGDRCGEGNTLGNLGIAYKNLGDARKAIEFYEQQLKIACEIGDRRGEGAALFNAALALDQLGNRAQALARAEAALQIFESIEDPNAAKVRAQLAQWRGEA